MRVIFSIGVRPSDSQHPFPVRARGIGSSSWALRLRSASGVTLSLGQSERASTYSPALDTRRNNRFVVGGNHSPVCQIAIDGDSTVAT